MRRLDDERSAVIAAALRLAAYHYSFDAGTAGDTGLQRLDDALGEYCRARNLYEREQLGEVERPRHARPVDPSPKPVTVTQAEACIRSAFPTFDEAFRH